MTYLVRNKEFRVRHENITGSGNQGKLGRYWFDDTAARLGGTDGVYAPYSFPNNLSDVNLTGTQTILQDDIGIIRTTTSGVDSGLPEGEYELIYTSLTSLSNSSTPHSYQIVQHELSTNTSTFTPSLIARNISRVSAYEGNGPDQRGVDITWSDWTSGLTSYRMYNMSWRFSTTGAANGSRSNLRIYNQANNIHTFEWEDIRIIKLN